MVRFHPRLVRALLRHHHQEWRERRVPLPPEGRLEPAWYPDRPLSGSAGASYEPVDTSRVRRSRRR